MNAVLSIGCPVFLVVLGVSGLAYCQGMDEMWGEAVVKLRAEDAKRGELFTNA